MNTETVIADHPPLDGKDWDCQCARCGSSCGYERCTDLYCDASADGWWDEEELNDGPCDICDGYGGWYFCLSSKEWCNANPLPGREDVKRGELEWFVVERD